MQNKFPSWKKKKQFVQNVHKKVKMCYTDVEKYGEELFYDNICRASSPTLIFQLSGAFVFVGARRCSPVSKQ